MKIASWCTNIIRWSFAILFVLVPLILTQWNYELFEYNKMMLTYGFTAIIVGAWIIKMIAEGKVRIQRTPLDIPIGLFFASQLISTIFSMDPHVSWFGYYSRFNGGLLSVISYILLYYAFISNWTDVTKLLKVTLASAVVVTLYAALEHYGHSISCLLFTGKFDDACWVQDVQNRVFATLGQPNWLAAYIAAILPISIAYAIEKKIKHKEFWLWGAVSVLFFAVLLFTKSRSGLIGFAIADIAFWGFQLVIIFQKKHGAYFQAFQPLLLLHMVFLGIVFFTGTNIDFLDRLITLKGLQLRTPSVQLATPSAQPKTDTLLSTGGTESSVIRKYVWEGAVTAWKSSVKTFLIGTGTETFAFAFYQFKPAAHNLTSEWDFLYNKAHNEYLNYLATTGIFGLGSYLLFIGIFIIWFIRSSMTAKFKAQDMETTSIALFAGWLSILITNFFGFSVVIIQLFFFLFPAVVLAVAYQQQPDKMFTKNLSLSLSVSRFASFTTLLVLVVILIVLGRFWWADTRYNKGYQYNRAGRLVEAKDFLADAIDQNPTEPVYYDEDSVVLAQLAVSQIEAHNATDAAALARQSLKESDIALTISPNNLNFWKSRTKIFYAFSSFDPTFAKAAIEALVRAQVLAPTDPKVTYNLAILYGKLGDNQKAIDTLKATIEMKPNYRDAYAAIVIFYKEVKQPALARQAIETYLTKVDPQDSDFQQQLKQL